MSAIAETIIPREDDLILRARQKAKTDPVWFARHILNLKRLPGEKPLTDQPDSSWELDQWTIELLEATADIIRFKEGQPTKYNHEGINQITIRAMHGPGKTFGLALLMHWFGFCFKGKNPCTAPKLDQLKRRLWPEFRKIRNRAIPGYADLCEVSSETVRWMGPDGKVDPDHWSFMETASSPENLAGLHDRYMLICVDEATGVSENLWPVIEGATSTGKYVILVIISNPTKLQGTFAASHLKPLVAKHWYKIHITLDKTTRVSRDWVRRMEDKYGKGSPIVKIRCYGEFSEEDENQLISMSWLENSRALSIDPDGSVPKRRIAVDVADGGGNFSVTTLATHYQSFIHFDKQEQFNFPSGQSVSMLANEVERIWREHGLNLEAGDDIVVDSLGVGAGVCSILIDRGYPVIRYVGGARSDNTDLYRNRRVQSYLVCRDKFRNGSLVLDEDFVPMSDWDDVYGQLCSIRIKHGTGRFEDLMTKDERSNAGIISPDRADSIAMQFATQSPEMTIGDVANYFVGQQMETSRYDGGLT
jgi:hypothetical protein